MTRTRRWPHGGSPWSSAHGPVALALTRQKLPVLHGTAARATDGVARGGYVLADAVDQRRPHRPSRTSSSSRPARSCRWPWTPARSSPRRASGPGWCRCPAGSSSRPHPRAYRDEVLPPSETRRVSIEAGVSLGWDRWVGTEGAIIAIDRYGASAPASELFPAFGFTAAPRRVRGPTGHDRRPAGCRVGTLRTRGARSARAPTPRRPRR